MCYFLRFDRTLIQTNPMLHSVPCFNYYLARSGQKIWQIQSMLDCLLYLKQTQYLPSIQEIDLLTTSRQNLFLLPLLACSDPGEVGFAPRIQPDNPKGFPNTFDNNQASIIQMFTHIHTIHMMSFAPMHWMLQVQYRPNTPTSTQNNQHTHIHTTAQNNHCWGSFACWPFLASILITCSSVLQTNSSSYIQ